MEIPDATHDHDVGELRLPVGGDVGADAPAQIRGAFGRPEEA